MLRGQRKGPCLVCHAADARYECRCGVKYCSAMCCQLHRLACVLHCPPQSTGSVGEEGLAVVDTGRSCDVSTIDHEAVPYPTRSNHGDEIHVLNGTHLAALVNDREIRQALRSGQLQQFLSIVDSSRSRLDALETGLHNEPQFAEFCMKVLRRVYVAHETHQVK